MSRVQFLRLPKQSVSGVSDVQALAHAGLSCNDSVSGDVSGVSAVGGRGSADTSDTSAKTVPYQAKSNAHAGCTLETSDTSAFNDAGYASAITPTEGDAP